MNTQELRNKIDNILGNSLRVLLPSYWWKKLFHHVADTIDGNEQLIIESFREFEKKHPDIASRTFYITLDENSEEAAHNKQLCQQFFISFLRALDSGTKFHNDPYYLAVPLAEDEESLECDVRLITCPQYSFAEGGVAFWDVGIGEKQFIVLFFLLGNGIPEIAPVSGSTNITVDSSLSTTSTNPVQNKVVTNALNNKQTTLVSGSNIKTINGNSILGSGDLKIEMLGAIVSRDLYAVGLKYGQTGRVITELTSEMKDYNKVTKQLFLEGKADVRIVYVRDGIVETFPVWHYFNYYDSFYFVEPFDHVSSATRLQMEIHCVRVEDDGTATWERYRIAPDKEVIADSYNAVSGKAVKAYVDGKLAEIPGVTVDSELSDTSENPVQNKVIKAYVDNAVQNVEIDVDSALSSSSTNPVQNKVVANALSEKQNKLVSGTSIKTINGDSILGEGNIIVSVADEVYIGTTPPTDENVTIWIDPSETFGDVA